MENIWTSITNSFGISDVIDILIVAFLIYKVLQFIRETRAEQLAKGVVLFVVITVLAKWLHLYTLHWILSSLVTVGVLALVIVFQPEIRRGLEYLGRNKFGSLIVEVGKEEANRIIKEFVSAVMTMSKDKTGALIVIEREISLNDIAETGTIIDSRISDQMIGNIFYEGAPLHDGALIVRGNKLHAAGCVLPLTEDKGLQKELGTRHRAGIGISENSDAFVIIVSEESGTISIATDGKLIRGYTKETLETALESIYLKKYEGKKKPKPFTSKSDKSDNMEGGSN